MLGSEGVFPVRGAQAADDFSSQFPVKRQLFAVLVDACQLLLDHKLFMSLIVRNDTSLSETFRLDLDGIFEQ
jgi:hypothetical protein